MIHFFSVVQLLFILINVSSEQCHERNVIQVIGGTKESSHGTISTPNFPEPFQTPFNQSWVIDASNYPDGTLINVYLTQMYLIDGIKFFQRPTFKFCDNDQSVVKPRRQECKNATHQFTNTIHFKEVYDLIRISTTCPYVEIQVTVPELWGYHYRTSDPFLFHVYGFNITYEIVRPEDIGQISDSCYIRNCSNLGHCYLADNWKDFFCDCTKGHPGRYCEVSPYCDPENNVTFCSNGGTCKILGAGTGYCECKPEFTGARCEKRIAMEPVAEQVTAKLKESQSVKALTRTSSCTPETSKSPCSCRPTPRSGRIVKENWRKYEAVISITSNYTSNSTGNSLTMMGYYLQSNISEWFKNKGLPELEIVAVTFQTHRKDSKPSLLRIHLHGPLEKRNETHSVLKDWIPHEINYSKTNISFLNKTVELHTIPRMQHKSVEKNKKLKIGKTVIISCTATTGNSTYFAERDIRFRWFKDNLPINVSLATRHMTMGKTYLNEDETTSVLMIDVVSALDGGTYYCEVTDMAFGDQQCGQQEVEVILPPKIELEPMSLTLEKRKMEKGIVITCTDASHVDIDPHNKSTEFMWLRTGSTKELINTDAVVKEELIPQGKLLRILRADHSESFTCRGFSKDGDMRSRSVQVRVLDSKNSPSCNRHWERLARSDEKLLWEWTAPNTVAMIQCPKDFYGYVQRSCIVTSKGRVQWGKTDFSRCVSETLMEVNHTLQNAKGGFGYWQASSAVRLMEDVEKYMNTSKVLYHGEGEKIIAIMEDIVQYAKAKGKVKVNGLFPVFFRTVVKFLKMRNSCVDEQSVQALCQIIVDVAVSGAMQEMSSSISKEPQINSSDVFLLQTLYVSAEAKYDKVSYMFPHQDAFRNDSLEWLQNKLSVEFPLDSEGFKENGYIIMAAYKNLSLLLSPNDDIQAGTKKSLRNSIKLISPVVQISIPEVKYYFPKDSPIKINFNLSKQHRSLVRRTPITGSSFATQLTLKGTYFSCGVLDNTSSTKTDYGGLRWSMGVCTMDIYENYVECQCDKLGIFGLLKVSNLEDEIPRVNNDIPGIIIAGFSFCILSCILSAVLLCLYLKCRISPDSLYALKLADCFMVFCAVFIILIGRNEMSSSSWLVWSASACSFLIGSLSIQITKALRVLLMEAKVDTPGFVFPWLRNVSQINLLSAITFSTVLPVWTGTVAKIIGQDTSNESAFKETSHVFAIFVATVGLVVLVFLAIYYKAFLKTRAELDTFQEQSSAPNSYASADMRWVLTYRMKTLNRSLCITLVLLVMILGIILYENIRHSIFIQYFLGLSTTTMGTVLFLSYVTHSEYTMTTNFCHRNHSEKPLRRDPEKDFSHEANGSQRKLYNISSDVAGNGSIMGTTGLLPPPPPPILRNPTRHFGEECESLSASTVEEQSMDTFSTEASYTAPSVQVLATTSNRNSRSMRSGSNTSGSSYRSRKYPTAYSGAKPANAPCLIGGLTGDYIMPSNHSTTARCDRQDMQELSSSPAPSSSYNNYLPIRDDDIQQKISHDLNILLKD
ncbi:unnamed protein product [Orchesella dallaii]|uniref:Brain-specific angiogenesis inhibitor 1 n=1 Tax=Orchesella dallaii TaxID=48710 RepID=A0ABP1QXB7_9HEXA